MAPEPRGNAWDDLIKALTLLRKGATDTVSPLHCEHDTLWVLADPEKFTAEETEQLDAWGFFVDSEGGFSSFRFGSA
jgi:hypothetical protein